MAEKKISVLLGGNQEQIAIEGSFSREDLYGKQRVSIEKDGVELEKVLITQWGDVFSPRDFKSQTIDSSGSLAESTVPSDENGVPLPIQTSSFKETRDITPAKWSDLAGFRALSVMPASCGLPAGVYRTKFTYRDSANLQDAFLIVKETEAFLLSGEIRETPLKGLAETYNFFESEEEESDDEMGFDSL